MAKINNTAAGVMTPSARSTIAFQHDWGSVARESVAAILSLLIVGLTFYFMWAMFVAPDDVAPTRWQRQSTVLQLALSLTGTVIGYYFARIPAEKAVSAAQQNEAAAVTSAEEAIASKERLVGAVEEAYDDLTPQGGGNDQIDIDAVRANLARRLEQILRRA